MFRRSPQHPDLAPAGPARATGFCVAVVVAGMMADAVPKPVRFASADVAHAFADRMQALGYAVTLFHDRGGKTAS
jgi:hypothetical protein